MEDMVTDQVERMALMTCGRCRTELSATDTGRAKAREQMLGYWGSERRAEAEDAEKVEHLAVILTGRDAGWEADHDSTPTAWLCQSCADVLASERTDPCPDWCNDCDGYSFFAQGTTHRRAWKAPDGTDLAWVSKNVPAVAGDPDEVAFIAASLFNVGDEDKSLADLRALAALATEVADFLVANNLTVGEVK